jgi:hypothetical protein
MKTGKEAEEMYIMVICVTDFHEYRFAYITTINLLFVIET